MAEPRLITLGGFDMLWNIWSLVLTGVLWLWSCDGTGADETSGAAARTSRGRNSGRGSPIDHFAGFDFSWLVEPPVSGAVSGTDVFGTGAWSLMTLFFLTDLACFFKRASRSLRFAFVNALSLVSYQDYGILCNRKDNACLSSALATSAAARRDWRRPAAALTVSGASSSLS